MKDKNGNLHEVNWLTAQINQNALGWTKATESEIQAKKRKTTSFATSRTASAESETNQMIQNAALASSVFDSPTTEPRSDCNSDGVRSHHSNYSDSNSSHSHHSNHDYSSHSSHDSGSSYDCSGGSDFGGGDF
jgi:hypothetical protein